MAFPRRAQDLGPKLSTYVRAHLHQPIRLTDLAARLHMTPSSYCRAFHQATGLTPMHAVRAQRLQHAQALLRTTAQPLRQIAAAVGYQWLSTFCQTFRRHVGLSPETYRRLHQAPARAETLPRLLAVWPRVPPDTQAAVLAVLEEAARGGTDHGERRDWAAPPGRHGPYTYHGRKHVSYPRA